MTNEELKKRYAQLAYQDQLLREELADETPDVESADMISNLSDEALYKIIAETKRRQKKQAFIALLVVVGLVIIDQLLNGGVLIRLFEQ